MNENMKLWKSVEETNPHYTRKVNQRGGFTTVSAQYQIMRATETWGPIGSRWGYSVKHSTIEHGTVLLAVADTAVWYLNESDKTCTVGPVRGMAFIVNPKGYFDEDAPKKALTDGFTKCLSHIGFSADIFLGRYDDNKYLTELNQRYHDKASKPAEKKETTKPTVSVDSLKKDLRSAFDATLTITGMTEKELDSYLKGQDLPYDRDWLEADYEKALNLLRKRYAQAIKKKGAHNA